MIDFAPRERPPSPVKATGKPRPPASGKAPGYLPGACVRVELATDADARELLFRAIRPLLRPGQGRVTIGPDFILVEGLAPDRAAPVRLVLATIA